MFERKGHKTSDFALFNFFAWQTSHTLNYIMVITRTRVKIRGLRTHNASFISLRTKMDEGREHSSDVHVKISQQEDAKLTGRLLI